MVATLNKMLKFVHTPQQAQTFEGGFRIPSPAPELLATGSQEPYLIMNPQTTRTPRFTCVAFLLLVTIVFNPVIAQTQKKSVNNTNKSSDSTEWTILLTDLLRETRLVDSEHDRALLMAEVANAYWGLDNKRSRELFLEALDLALPLGPSKETRKDPVSTIIALAARREVSFAKTLMERAHEDKETRAESKRRSLAEVGADLLDSNPQTAIELALAGTGSGPSMSEMWFLFKLAEKHPLESQQVYQRYLQSLRNQKNRPLGNVLWLAGYPQGFGEAYGGANSPADLVGFAGMRISELSPQPRLAAAYLDVAHESITFALTQALTAPVVEKDSLNTLALFALEYLQEAVVAYRSDLQGHWAALHQRAMSVVSPAGRAESQNRLRSILEVRSHVSEYKTSEEYATGTAQQEVEKIERISGGCQRDEAYAKQVFALSYVKDFNGARQVIEKVENLSLRDALLQLVIFDQISVAIKNGDLIEAVRLTDKISAKELKALQYLRVATVAAKAPDKSLAIDALTRARSLADSMDPTVQANILMTVADIYSDFDSVEATNDFSRAIKSLNSSKDQISTTFSVMRRVSFGCNGDDKWYGSREQVNDRNLYDTLAHLARKITASEALLLARNIEDRTARIRAQLAVVNVFQK